MKLTVNEIAKVCHEANKAYCESMGDNSQPPWESAPEWQKASALNGVNLHIDNPNLPPSASHEAWMKQKVEEGWVWGPEKSPERKEHPCLVAFEKLPIAQQAKDFIFSSIVKTLAHV